MKNKFRILKILITVILFGFLLSFSLKRFNDKPLDKVSVNLTQTKNPVYFIDEKDVKEIVSKLNPSKKNRRSGHSGIRKKTQQTPGCRQRKCLSEFKRKVESRHQTARAGFQIK